MFRLTLLTVALQACFIGHVGSGDAVSQEREVPAEAIAVSQETSVHTTVVAGAPSNVVRVTCDDNLIDELITDVKDGVLRIRTDRGTSLVPRADCLVEVRLVTLDDAGVSGSGDLSLGGDLDDLVTLHDSGSGALLVGPSQTCDLTVDVSGSGGVEFEHLEACEVIASISGTGRLVMKGRADSMVADVSGTGGLRSPDFEVNAADIAISGTGGLRLTVHHVLRARLSGTGGATIYGDPQERDVRESGTGRVRFESGE